MRMSPSPYASLSPAVGEYPAEAGCEYVVALVGDMNGRDGEFEGPLPNAIRRFGRYELRDVPLADLLAAGHDHSPDLAREYAAMDPGTRPPGVYDPVAGDILDGTHRARGAEANGEAAMRCYVGVVGSEDPFWSEWED